MCVCVRVYVCVCVYVVPVRTHLCFFSFLIFLEIDKHTDVTWDSPYVPIRHMGGRMGTYGDVWGRMGTYGESHVMSDTSEGYSICGIPRSTRHVSQGTRFVVSHRVPDSWNLTGYPICVTGYSSCVTGYSICVTGYSICDICIEYPVTHMEYPVTRIPCDTYGVPCDTNTL